MEISSRCSSEELGLVAVICWAIWSDRNKIAHEESIPPVNRRSQWIMEYMASFVEANSRKVAMHAGSSRRSSSETNRIWIPPPFGFLKINVDAWIDSLPATGIGLICRRSDGSIFESSSNYLDISIDAPGVELRAILEGVKKAISLGCRKVIMESDYQMAINFLTRKSKVWSSVEGLVEEIWALVPHFTEIQFQYTHRDGNKAADRIAKRAKLVKSSESWDDIFPDWLCILVENDLSYLAHVA